MFFIEFKVVVCHTDALLVEYGQALFLGESVSMNCNSDVCFAWSRNLGVQFQIVSLAFLVCVCFLVVSPTKGMAESKFKAVIKLEKQISKQQKKLAKQFNRLRTEDKLKVISKRSGRSVDSDFDGVPDNLEDYVGRCNSDSDSDGVNDGDEYFNGSNPFEDDSESNGGSSVGSEIEVHSTIQAISNNSLAIDGELYLVSSETEFVDNNNIPVNFSFFEVGDCVEAEAHLNGADRILNKLALDDDCGGGVTVRLEFNSHGILQSVESNSFTASGIVYTTSESTEYLDDHNNPVLLSFYTIGACLEIQGRLEGGSRIVEVMKLDDSC